MALRISYIGESLSAMGYALVGAQRFTPELTAPAVAEALETARAQSSLVLIETAYAALIQELLQATLIEQPLPPILVVPALHEQDSISDHSVRSARTVLGIG